jgi:ribosome-associated toxin RatA of RatAB toxin-antitoxin module
MKTLRYILIFLIVLTIATPHLTALDYNAILEKSPLISINRDKNGSFESVMILAVIYSPFETVWKTIMDINAYPSYMPRVLKAKVFEKNEYGKEIKADYELEVPIKNTKYTLSHYFDSDKKTIDVKQISGDLNGSSWYWKFEEQGDKTLVMYTGRIVNFSKFLQAFDDKEQTISVGINISSCLATIKSIKDRSEDLFKQGGQ